MTVKAGVVPERKLLFKSGSVEIAIRELAQTAEAVVCFSYLNWGSFKEFGFSEQYWLEKGYSVVSVQSDANDWFNAVPIEAIRDVGDLLKCNAYQQILAYGASMGGFAALAFRAELRATHVIAFSPQFSVKSEFDDRWANEFVGEHLHAIRRMPNEVCKCLVVYDPFSKDKLHIDRIRNAIPTLTTLALPNSGHHPGSIMNELKLLDKCQSSFLADESLRDYFVYYKRERLTSDTYLLGLGWKLGGRRYFFAVHARYVVSRVKNVVDEFLQLTQRLDERFLDVGRWIRAPLDPKLSILDKHSPIEVLASKAIGSILLFATPEDQRYDVSESSENPVLQSCSEDSRSFRVEAPSGGCYRVDLSLPLNWRRFVDVSVTGIGLASSCTSFVLDIFSGFAFNSSSEVYGAVWYSSEGAKVAVFFQVPNEDIIYVRARNRDDYFGIVGCCSALSNERPDQ